MEQTQRVNDLKVRLTAEPEIKVSKTGKEFWRAKGIHEKDDGEKVWLTLMGFGGIKDGLQQFTKKGSLMKVDGGVKKKEYTNKDGEVAVDTTLFVNSAKIATVDGVKLVDDFFEKEAQPF